MEDADKSNLWNYNPNLKSFARQNRNDMTKAEVCIWKYVLSRKQLMGYQFRRQRPVGNYIADFLCKELMLIIEIDGITHQFEDVVQNDRVRQQRLEEMGFTVLRFEDDEVLNDLGNVVRTLTSFIEDYKRG